MALLAIDTASHQCAVHLENAGGKSVSRMATMTRGHGECLFPMLDDAFDEMGISYRDLTALGVTRGPGSFTGVRVGLSAARGFALALDIPLVGISSLAAMAASFGTGAKTLVLIDAKRGQVYGQLFDGTHTPLDKPSLVDIDGTLPPLWMNEDALSLIGSGAPLVQPLLQSAFTLTDVACPDIKAVASCARLALTLSIAERQAAFPASPLYLRGPDAKPQNPASVIARASGVGAQP